MTNYIIEQINLSDVYEYDRIRFNSNNHWDNNTAPSDYKEVLTKTYLSNWIHYFRPDYQCITINDAFNLSWLKKASQLGFVTGKFSSIYLDELDQLCCTYDNPAIFNGTNYFVRADNVSLKQGCHGCGPFTSLRQIIEGCCTCISGHTPIHDNLTELKLFLFPWINMSSDLEFRVFVCNNRITCISQQDLYNSNKILNQIDDENENKDEAMEKKKSIVTQWAAAICEYYNTNIYPKLYPLNIVNYSMDISILPNGDVYLIELNSFGKEYAAGSSLFHWIINYDELYGANNNIYVRYCQ